LNEAARAGHAPPGRLEGWRLNIGAISPAPVMSRFIREFHEVVPDGVDITTVTLSTRQIADVDLKEAATGIEHAALQLAAYDVDLIYLIGVPPIVLHEPGFDRVVIDRIAQASGLPALTDITGVMTALSHLGIRTLALATPFEDIVNERIERHLAAAGFAVVNKKGLGIRRNVEFRHVPIPAEYDLARRTYEEAPSRPDGIYIPCGGWGSIRNVERLESDLDTCVVTWMNALIWNAMHRLQVSGPITGFGTLLGSL
jgi:maleate cis-trans isomerase